MEFSKIGEYEIIERLGSGSMGDVYKAKKNGTNEIIAIKVLSENLAKDPRNVIRFKREITHTIMLDHPNILVTFAAGDISGRPYSVMEYVNGKPVSKLIQEKQKISEQESVKIITQVAKALKYAHDFNGLIHRDIKPDNIFVRDDGVTKLMDMGIAKTTNTETKITQAGMTLGSPGYMSPEQSRADEDLDARSDIFSLGSTFYHMVTGHPPFPGIGPVEILLATVNEEPKPINEHNPKASLEVCEIIKQMMEKERERRYQNYVELLQDLKSLEKCEDMETIRKKREVTVGHKFIIFRNCFVPSMSDVILAQLAIRNNLLSVDLAHKALNMQEFLALSGMEMQLDSILVKQNLLNMQTRGALLAGLDDFLLRRFDDTFAKIAKSLQVFDQWKQIWEQLKGQETRGIVGELMAQKLITESELKKILPFVKHSIAQEESTNFLKLAVAGELISQVQAKKCHQICTNNVNLGKYRPMDDIIAERGLIDDSGTQALMRAVRRSTITRQPALECLKELQGAKR